MIGKYLNSLPAAALDRVQNAERWRTHGYVQTDGARCILGHVEDWQLGADGQPHCGDPGLVELRQAGGDHMYNWPPLLGVRFDKLVERFGMERVVGLIKARAGVSACSCKEGTKIFVLS